MEKKKIKKKNTITLKTMLKKNKIHIKNSTYNINTNKLWKKK